MENFRERWNEDTIGEREPSELVHREIRDAGSPSIPQIAGLNDWIVVYYDGAIAGRMYVELDTFRAQLNGAEEGGNGILGESVVRTPVGNRHRGVRRSNQEWPLLS
jgi:hypothetical protein